MEGRGTQTKMPRAALPRSGESADAIILLAAFGVASLFVAVQIGFSIALTPVSINLYSRAGLGLPAFLAFAEQVGAFGIIGLLGVVDALIFALCAWAARKYWIGLLFVPPAIYLAITFAFFIAFIGGAAAVGLAG